MFDRIINILVIEQNEEDLSALMQIIRNVGHNIFIAKNDQDALKLLEEKKFVLVFCSLDLPNSEDVQLLRMIHHKNVAKNYTVIATSSSKEKLYASVGKNSAHMAMDYLVKPYVTNLVQAKIEVYKKLFFKHQRVSQLLESIFAGTNTQ